MAGDTQLTALSIVPGINRDRTEYMAEGGWWDCDKIRFRSGNAEKIGGFVRETTQQATASSDQLFHGVSRAILSWTDLQFNKYLAVAGNTKVEIMNGNKIYDVTPVRLNVTAANIITTVSGQSSVTITKINHGAVVGDYVFVNSQGTSPYNNIALLGEYQVTVVTDADHFKITAGTTASGSGTGGGTLNIDLLLENGQADNGNLTGWGGGSWGTPGAAGHGWGYPRSGVGGVNLRQWSLDNWGEDLIACVRFGKIYQWDATGGLSVRLQPISGAPDTNLFVLVSQPSRHLIAFGSEVEATGTFDPLIIRWASQETLTDWTITASNTAGEYRLPKGNTIVGACQTRGEILVFTDTDVYSMRYVGGTDIFQFQPLGSNVSAVSQHSFIDVNGVIYWRGLDAFYMYDGVVHVLPCTLLQFTFDQDGEGRINKSQKEKVFAGICKEFNEIWWFEPNFADMENSQYKKYNYMDNTWDFGTMDRTVWLDRGIFDRVYAINGTGRLYVHEQGKDADGAPLQAFIRSAYFDVGDGQNIMFCDRIVPDVDLPTNNAIQISVWTKRYPHPNAKITTKGPYFFDDNAEKLSIRARGRQMAIKYEVNSTGSDFKIGKTRLGLQPDGSQ